MSKKPLTTLRIASQNLRGKPWHTFALITVVGILAFALFGSSILTNSLNNGINSLKARLGADIAVVPPGHEAEYEGIVLSGAPVKFYFDRGIERQIAGIEGVDQVTSQFFLASLSAGCCSTEVQLIGIDYATDFVIKPWISQVYSSQIGNEELIIGDAVPVNEDGTLTFFNKKMKVAAQLAKTSTGMDRTVYVNMSTMHELAEAARDSEVIPKDLDIMRSVSAVMLKTSPDFSSRVVYDSIRRNVPGVGIIISQNIISNIAENLNIVSGMIHSLSVALTVIVILMLVILFSVFAFGRKKEFAVLRIIGATQGKLASIVLLEALMVSLYGAVIGITLAALMLLPFGNYWELRMGLPFLMPGLGELIKNSAAALLMSVGAGSVSVAYSAYKISKAETYATMREGE